MSETLWLQIIQRLRTMRDYQAGVVVELPDSLGGEKRFYYWGKWHDLSFAAMYPDMFLAIGLDDIFPKNPDRE